MARQTKSELKLTEAADKATALLQGLQSRLNREATAVVSMEESPDELDRQLQEYFKAEPGNVPDQIRERVIDAVADRILKNWETGERRELGGLENQVIERVAARILERMGRR
jgi:KaiC/GvpD/RAD55 family RecA-like ATPase